MRRKMNVLAAALAVVAFSGILVSSALASGTFTAPGAGAVETTTTKILKDGTGKTSHQVFDLGTSNGSVIVSMTCEELTGTGHLIGPANEEFTLIRPGLGGCTAGGQALAVSNLGCNFRFKANGELHIVNDGANICAHGKQPIMYEFPGCKFEIGAQTLNGIKYHNLNAAGTTVGSGEGSKITVERSGIQYTYNAVGAACNFGTTNNGNWTTGNFILEGQRPAGTAVELRWDS